MGKRQENGDEKNIMIEWRSRLDGPSGLILLLCFMVLWSYITQEECDVGEPPAS